MAETQKEYIEGEAIKDAVYSLFKEACVGMTKDDRMVYDYDKMVEVICKFGYERTNAIEIIDFVFSNDSMQMEGSPVILYTLYE